MINTVDQLFQNKSVNMFANKELYLIHPQSQPCANASDNNDKSNTTEKHKGLEFVTSMYPKQRFLPLLCETLFTHNLIDEQLYFVSAKNIHLADFISFINNRFSKGSTVDMKYIKLCKYLQSNDIRFPRVSIKNPLAQKYLC